MTTPYSDLPKYRFWKTGVEEPSPRDLVNIHKASVKLKKDDQVVTMGSCFAQHIAKWLREEKFSVPYFGTDCNVKSQNFSASYGNVYTVRQAVQILREACGTFMPSEVSWEVDGGFIDCFRPNVHSEPFQDEFQVQCARAIHLSDVRRAIKALDLFIFTLGLTEAWRIKKCGAVVPVAPGVLGGKFSKHDYEFVNFRYSDVVTDLSELYQQILTLRDGKEFKMILTVSPVPLTATAVDRHVLQSSVYSKSVLRAAAGDFSEDHKDVDYFPSFEVITNPAARSEFFETNVRSVRPVGVSTVMSVFAESYQLSLVQSPLEQQGGVPRDVDCEDALLEGFSGSLIAVKDSFEQSETKEKKKDPGCLFFGDSHLTGVLEATGSDWPYSNQSYVVYNYLTEDPFSSVKTNQFRRFNYRPDTPAGLNAGDFSGNSVLVISGCGFLGDAIIRAHGSLEAGFEGCIGSKISPKVPQVAAASDDLANLYDTSTTYLVERARHLEAYSSFERIFWIAAPDMVESTARFRLGDGYVESRSHWHHREAYLMSLRRKIAVLQRTEFIFHPWTELCGPSGFSLDRFRARQQPWDIHCSGLYFSNAVSTLAERL